MNITLVLVFETSHSSQLRSFVAWLINEGGAIDTPTVEHKDGRTEMTTRFSEFTDTRLVAKHAEEWALQQHEVEFIGLRDATVVT